ncbi:hypothetical protein GCM10027168_37230 [Streptomyces capparidis]
MAINATTRKVMPPVRGRHPARGRMDDADLAARLTGGRDVLGTALTRKGHLAQRRCRLTSVEDR